MVHWCAELEKADDAHYAAIAERLAAGRIVPFLGAGANLADRGDEPWEPGSPFLPSGAELAAYLIERGDYPLADDDDLLRVSQYVDAEYGEARPLRLPPRRCSARSTRRPRCTGCSRASRGTSTRRACRS